MTTDYRPIDCDQHSVLELLAMRGTPVTVAACDESGAALRREGVVDDVLTRDGAEYLMVRDARGEELAVRLDRLQALFGRDGGLLWRQEIAGT
jgi:Rho-binding antiterminator